MNTLETLKQAIENKEPISFEYNKEGKIKGKRTGARAEIVEYDIISQDILISRVIY